MDMREYFVDFMEQYDYPEEAKQVLLRGFDVIFSNEGLRKELSGLLQCYDENKKYDLGVLVETMKGIAAQANVHEYTGNLILFICLSRRLKKYFEEAGMEEEVWFDTMADLKWKLFECKNVYHIWGNFTPSSYDKYYGMWDFGIGRLQFELLRFGAYYEKDGVILTPDSQVINVHIPRTGTRLDLRQVEESYTKASIFFRKFFPEIFDGKPIIFVCHSWLLFLKNLEVLSPQSNIAQFIADYDIFEQGEFEDYSQVWRLFDCAYDGDVEKLPQDSSLRRAYADWIRRGEKIGWGYGVYVYDKGGSI